MSRDSTAVVRFIELAQQRPIFDPDAPKNVDTQVVKRPASRVLLMVAIGAALIGVGFGVGLYVGKQTDTPALAVATTAPVEADLAPAPPSQPPSSGMPVITPINAEDMAGDTILESPDELEPEIVHPDEPEVVRPRSPGAESVDTPARPDEPTVKKPKKTKSDDAHKATKELDPRLGGASDEPEPDRSDSSTGALAINAKPPCLIYIDGRNTGLETPQRSIELTPGKHRITLINAEHRINTSIAVNIEAGKTTRIVRDMMDKLDAP